MNWGAIKNNTKRYATPVMQGFGIAMAGIGAGALLATATDAATGHEVAFKQSDGLFGTRLGGTSWTYGNLAGCAVAGGCIGLGSYAALNGTLQNVNEDLAAWLAKREKKNKAVLEAIGLPAAPTRGSLTKMDEFISSGQLSGKDLEDLKQIREEQAAKLSLLEAKEVQLVELAEKAKLAGVEEAITSARNTLYPAAGDGPADISGKAMARAMLGFPEIDNREGWEAYRKKVLAG